jgi:long-chain fatty acid transport protein
MKKSAVLLWGMILLLSNAYAGGILTNTNQSAQFVRMLSRNASIDLDAVYFNPAGLTQMKNGFYFGLHNQTILQTKTITSDFGNSSTPLMPLIYDKYEGDVKVPVFPTAFAVYKLDNWAFSVGFGPNAGGGSAKYGHGLPSFEKQIARMVPKLSGLSSLGYPVADYGVDISFEGTSVFWGIQGGATYKINKVLSVYFGGRYVPAVNTYAGNISNIQLGPIGGMQNAQTYLTGAAAAATAKASQLSALASFAGSLSANDPVTNSTLQATLTLLGQDPSKLSNAAAKTILTSVSNGLTATSLSLTGTVAMVGDKNVDVKQTGAGVTPIIGVDIHLDKLNIGLKYEHKTIVGLTNKTVVDGTGLFPDGGKSNSDIPAIIAGGADYQVSDKFKISGSFNLYMDKNVNWGKNIYQQDRTIDKNYLELAFGAEYKLTDKFALSAGYLNSNTGVSEQYQSDFSFSNDSYTTGLGLQWNINKRLVLDAGIMLTTYKNSTKTFTEAAPIGTYNETYGKDTFDFAFGIGYKIF